MMAPLRKRRLLHNSDTEEECKDDNEMIVSTDACAEDNVKQKIFYLKYRSPPRNSDLQGIKSLLKETFPNAHLDLDSLTRLIISQCLCLVLKQTSSDDEDADEINDPVDMYGVSTVVGVKQNVNCIVQLRDHLMILANEYAPDSTKAKIIHILEDDAVKVELLINERHTDIPAEMAIPPLECLVVTMRQARCGKGMNCVLASTYCIYICKIFKTTKKKKESNEIKILKKEKILWINLEEKVIAQQATYSFEFPVDSELVNGLPNKSWIDGPDYWNPDDYDTAVPYRRVLIFEFSKLHKIINKIRKKFNCYDSFYTTNNVQV